MAEPYAGQVREYEFFDNRTHCLSDFAMVQISEPVLYTPRLYVPICVTTLQEGDGHLYATRHSDTGRDPSTPAVS